jgi:ATP-dependent exoDNAse (exonuclease V) alpha subunit
VAIADERTGEIHDYTRKGGVESAELVLPAGAPEWAADRAALWNAAEQAETRKNSTVAREFEIALPEELSPAERQRLAHDFARELVERHGCAADVAIHAPGKDGDNRNHHAHILLSTRRLGPEGFTEKTRELDDQKTGPQIVTQWRERFATLTNERLRENGIDARVDHRTLEAQGIDREPTRHLGPAATGYERRTGEPSRKRLDFEAEIAERLARAKEAGELERQSRQIDRGILDLSGDLEAAKADRSHQQQAEQAKQQEAAREFARQSAAQFKAEQAARDFGKNAAEQFKADMAAKALAEQARQQAAEREIARQKQEAEAKRQAELERRQPAPKKDKDIDYGHGM